MKKYIFLTLVIGLLFGQLSAQTFEGRFIENEMGYMVYQLQQTSGAVTPSSTAKIYEITFDIAWLSSEVEVTDLDIICTNYQIELNGTGKNCSWAPGYCIHSLSMWTATFVDPGFTWQLNTWYDIAFLKVQTASTGTSDFELWDTTNPNYIWGLYFTYDINNNGVIDPNEVFTPTSVQSVTDHSFPETIFDYYWTGNTNTDWNVATNWKTNLCGTDIAASTAPIGTTNCFIPAGRTNYPSGTWGANGVCSSLRIASEAFVSVPTNRNLAAGTLILNSMTDVPGILTINPDATVDVSGMTYINGAQQIKIEADASGVGSFIDHGITHSSTGTAYVETYVVNDAPAGSYFAHLVGPTVTDQGFENNNSGAPGVYLIQFDLDYLGTYAYEWDENQATDGWLNVYPYGWPVYTGTGLLLSTIDASDYTMDMTGKLVTGDVTRSIGYGLNHLEIISNPYPSAIDWEVAYPANNAEVLSTYYIWNPSVAQYGTYNATTDLSTNGASKDIQVGQGFFVETQASASGFDFTNTQRLHSTQAFLKEEPANLLKIYASGFGTTDEINVCFMENATTGYDQLYDSKKWLSFFPEVTQIWTKSSDLVDLASNVLTPLTEEPMSVQMSVKLGFAGEYAISFENLSSFATGTQIFLEDLKTGAEWVNVYENPVYSFTGSPEDDQARFVLHFFGPTGIGEDGMTSLVKIYSSKQFAYILNNSDETLREYVVYDMTGRPVASGSLSNSTLNKIYVSDITGYYLVKVSSGENVYNAKVYISR